MNYQYAVKLLIFVSFFSFYANTVVAFANTTKEVSINVSRDAPKIQILQKNFILVGNADLPPNFSKIRKQWFDTIHKHDQSVFDVKNIPLPSQHKEQWANLSKLIPKMDSTKQLRNINGFFNRIPSRDDAYTYQSKEYWATPSEFLKKRAGDCEDYALAKYFALQYFSWPDDKLWVVFLRDNINNGMHVVLAAKTNKKVFILDNLSKPSQLLIPEEQYAKQVNVVALFNNQGMWLPLK